MGDGFNSEGNDLKMGATGNPNAARLASLQERRKTIEESLAKCNQELRQLCIQEADLTGIIPQEMPLEPGESPPLIRRRVGTSYQLPENLIKNSNNKDESITDLELQIQVHANLAEAALGLANEQNISKTLRRQHMAEYQQHKLQFTELQDKLTDIKEVQQKQQQQTVQQPHKQKKKPRPSDQDDNISINTNINDPLIKTELRHSMRSNKCSISNESEVDHRFSSTYPTRVSYKSSTNIYTDGSYRQEDLLASGIYRLNLNGYKNYMERRENIANVNSLPPGSPPQLPPLHYNQIPHYQSPPIPHITPTVQHQRSHPASYTHTMVNPYYNPNMNIVKNQGSPTGHLQRQSSPNSSAGNTQKMQYYQSHPINYQQMYRYSTDQTYRNQNPHQIQPHQQYEQNGMTYGLGGYWKRTESGETIWCNSIDSGWQRNKRFGSLDRRKNKRTHKRVSPCIDNKSATLASVPTYSEHVRTAAIKSPQIMSRRTQDNRQLVRTQSLGSVGAQTIDSVWPSDDNSSCESDNRSINDINHGGRKHKQKEWLETCLDGPVSPTHMPVARSQSAVPSVLSPEDKYIPTPVSKAPSPLVVTPKTSLEIPAESNPSPRIVPETNLELFNNNIPKNCTIVQAGHCKPYHEETKPFEMSDFYKYSTKFRSPQKQQLHDDNVKRVQQNDGFQKNLNDAFEQVQKNTFQSVKNHNFSSSSLSPGRVDNSASLNSSLDLSQIPGANVAKHFSDEMNDWYKSQKFQIDNNGSGPSKNKSTATLV